MTTPNQPGGGSHPIGSGDSSNSYNGSGANEYGAPQSNGYGSNGYNQAGSSADETSAFGGQGQQPGFNNPNMGYGAPQQGFQNNDNPQFGAYPTNDQNTGYGQVGTKKDSFFSALFDMSFTKYATPSVVKMVYILAMLGIGLFVLLGLIAALIGMTQDGGAIMLLVIPLILVGGLFYLAMVRVGLEVSISMIRTSQSVQSIDERQARNEVAPQNHSGPFGG